MADLVLHSRALSLYLRIATLVCEEKQINYRVAARDAPGEGFREFHPFEKMPVLQHGDLMIYETLAIADYVNRAFDGPALSPVAPQAHAEMLTWISLTNAYFFPTIMGGIAKPLLMAPLQGEPTDHDLVARSLPDLEKQIALLEASLKQSPYLVAGELSLADLFVLPNLFYASLTDEGTRALREAPKVQDWMKRLTSRPSFAATEQRP
ncbi:MAG: glutathione S-transferase family protein [Rhodobiaceae bacterium]|nr:glutathione S-transferase family protein [Rhodobiaceae bacterium]